VITLILIVIFQLDWSRFTCFYKRSSWVLNMMIRFIYSSLNHHYWVALYVLKLQSFDHKNNHLNIILRDIDMHFMQVSAIKVSLIYITSIRISYMHQIAFFCSCSFLIFSIYQTIWAIKAWCTKYSKKKYVQFFFYFFFNFVQRINKLFNFWL